MKAHFDKTIKLLENTPLDTIELAAELICNKLKQGNKLIIIGNGGSAADAQHFSAELIGRYKRERGPIPAISLTTDTSSITAIANDYGYDLVFARQLLGLAHEDDVLFAISTSGQSNNVLKAIEAAKACHLSVIGLTGKTALPADINISIPSDDTPHIQEVHGVVIHCLCEAIEKQFL